MRRGRRGALVRPFCERARVASRDYSLPLQRAMSDFGADHSFLQAVKKVREHYGVEIPLAAARQHTLAHARAIGAVEHPAAGPARTLVTGMDGSMIPLVQSGPGPDKRKGKTLLWKQANLCCARDEQAVDCVYGATLANVKMAGLSWKAAALGAGLAPGSRIHAVADGADPIFNAFNEQFGEWGGRAKFTVDYFHVNEHLSEAAESIAPDRKKEWLHEQHGRLLSNQPGEVLQILEAHFEAPDQEKAPVRAVHHYIDKRRGQMDYAGARAAGLPIGSGEIESAHRHVIQQRLKTAGAWWLFSNAEAMLQLRTARANNDWDRYWSKTAKN